MEPFAPARRTLLSLARPFLSLAQRIAAYPAAMQTHELDTACPAGADAISSDDSTAGEPRDPRALWALACSLRESDPYRALFLLDRLVDLAPGIAKVRAMRGLLRQSLRLALAALDDLAAAACLAPHDTDALHDVGRALMELLCPAQAEDIALLLLERRPHWAPARWLLARAQAALERDPVLVARQLDALVKHDPLNPELRYARGLLWLKTGDFARGWDGHEWRWAIEPLKSAARLPRTPRWAGEPLDGRRLLVLGEQGHGDMLQYARFLPEVVQRGPSRVAMQLDASRSGLARLLARIAGVGVVGPGDTDPDAYDLHCPLASLPYVLDSTLDTIPDARWFRPHAQDVAAWRSKLEHLPRPWVGVCWAGAPEHFHDARRSLPLAVGTRHHAELRARERRIGAASAGLARALGRDSLAAAAQEDARQSMATMEPLLRGTAGTFVSLQVGRRAGDLHELTPDLRQRFVAPLPPDADFLDTACLVSLLDDVLTVDTAVAHVAGIAAPRALVVEPAAAEWRWIERDRRSVWYPNLRMVKRARLAW
jgi:hypothetical protein